MSASSPNSAATANSHLGGSMDGSESFGKIGHGLADVNPIASAPADPGAAASSAGGSLGGGHGGAVLSTGHARRALGMAVFVTTVWSRRPQSSWRWPRRCCRPRRGPACLTDTSLARGADAGELAADREQASATSVAVLAARCWRNRPRAAARWPTTARLAAVMVARCSRRGATPVRRCRRPRRGVRFESALLERGDGRWRLAVRTAASHRRRRIDGRGGWLRWHRLFDGLGSDRTRGRALGRRGRDGA